MARMPVAGEVIDDVFRVEAEIDSGNFGSVYKVQDMAENRVLALKVLRPGVHDESELRRRFEREARLIYSLQHRHIVRVYYYGETNSGLPYMAMEYLEGTDLRTLLQHHGALNPALVKRITIETLSALDAAHSLGIIHRDLKPANIFLAKDGGKGHVKVLDFGFAKAMGDESPLADITNAGVLVGTPAYMAPELVHKKRIGPAADVYAMGLIMAEMVRGDKILEIESVYDTILFQASPTNIKFPPEVINSPFAEVINRATQKSIDKRYKTAQEMGADLGGLPSVDATTDPEVQAPVMRKLYITDVSDDDVTVPRAMGLPNEAELATLMGRSDAATTPEDDDATIVDTGEKTIEWGSVADQLGDFRPDRLNGSPNSRSGPLEPPSGPLDMGRPNTGGHGAVSHTPRGGMQRVDDPRHRRSSPDASPFAPRENPPQRRSSLESPLGRNGAPRTGPNRPVAGRPSHNTGRERAVDGIDTEIEDLGHDPRRSRRKKGGGGMTEVMLGLCLGALLLAIILIVLYVLG